MSMAMLSRPVKPCKAMPQREYSVLMRLPDTYLFVRDGTEKLYTCS